MNNFTQRAITGLFFVVFIVLMTLFNEVSFGILLILIGVLGLWEYFNIIFHKEKNRLKYLYIIYAFFVMINFFFHFIEKELTDFLFLSLLLVPLTFIFELFSKERIWKTTPLLLSGLLYVIVPLLMFFYSVNDGIEFKKYYALNLFILIWGSDTFAYLVGKAIGKTPLFTKISPKKTVEGFAGALVLNVGLGALLSHFFDIPMVANIFIALLSVIVGSLGDLVESQLKREHGLKDSGKLIPGHGGILDRFDAFFISLPFTSACYYFLG